MPKKKKIDPNDKKRKNFRIPSDLAAWAEEYAASKNTSVTQLVIDHWTELREQENA